MTDERTGVSKELSDAEQQLAEANKKYAQLLQHLEDVSKVLGVMSKATGIEAMDESVFEEYKGVRGRVVHDRFGGVRIQTDDD